MRKVLILIYPLLLVCCLTACSGNGAIPVVQAQEPAAATDLGTITNFQTGNSSDVLIVTTSAPFIDNGCNGGASAQYSTAPGSPGGQTIHSVLLAAMLSGKQVRLSLQGCVNGHPQIVGVYVQP